MPRTLAKATWARSLIGSFSKKAMFSRSASITGAFGAMLMALVAGRVALWAGQTSTQMPHPVQSST
jgi:type IV secretory pathway TrbF-like protein